MEELHGAIAEALTAAIKNPGEEGVNAAMLNVARAFLKDNGIEADLAVAKNPPLQGLVSSLPFAGTTYDDPEEKTGKAH